MKSTRSKQKEIHSLLSEKECDQDSMRHLCITSGGLLSKVYRRRLWPRLVNVERRRSLGDEQPSAESYSEYQQVYMDVQRCLSRFPPDMEYDERVALQDQLTNLIVCICVNHPELHYYQGYHDICVTFLVEVGEELAYLIMEELSLTVFKQFMEPTMEPTVRTLNYIWPIIGKYNPDLLSHLKRSNVEAIFCLSWVITWFGHVLCNYEDIVRLYDFFLATNPLMPIYLSAAIVLHKENEILALEEDMAVNHHYLSKLPSEVPLECMIKRAFQISEEFLPKLLMERTTKCLPAISNESEKSHRRLTFDVVVVSIAVFVMVVGAHLFSYN